MVTGAVSLLGPDPRPTFRFQTTPVGAYVEPGYVEPGYVGGSALATYTAQVESSLIDSFDADPLWQGVRVVIDGQDVPAAELAGPVRWTDTIDSPIATAELRLVGRRWSSFLTDRSWTQVPIEIYHVHGQAAAGDQAMREDLVFRGIVLPSAPQDTNGSLMQITVKAASRAHLYARQELCYEVSPLSGKSRGQISEEVGLSVGLLAFEIPAGDIYTRPVFTAQQKLFDFLKQFGEPEQWHWDLVEPDDTLRAYLAEVKLAPLVPDAAWHLDHVESIQVESPPQSPSRWIVRGFRTLLVDEAGVSTERTRVEFESEYAPKVATHQQNATTGDPEPTGLSPEVPTLRVTSVLEDEVQRQGQRILSQTTREWGFKNPRAGRLKAMSGPTFDFTNAYLDEEGGFVTWRREKFVQVGERRQWNIYAGEEGERLAEVNRQEYRWRAIPAGGVLGRLISDEDEDFQSQGVVAIEAFGLDEGYVQRFKYVGTVALQETRETWTHLAIRERLSTGKERYDGTAITETNASFKLAIREQVFNILSANNDLRGTTEVKEEWRIHPVVGGAHDFGDFEATDTQERFRTTSRKNTIYKRLTRTLYQVIVLETGKPADIKTLTGQPPPPQFASSPWTLLEQQPIETLLEDPLALARFGFQRDVIESDYTQSTDEAIALIDERRRRLGAHRVTVRRPLTYVRKADTVELTDPTQGIAHRCLVVGRACEVDPLVGRATGTYTLEVNL